MSRGPGEIQQKILLLLLGGATLALSRSPTQHRHILRLIGKAWKEINREALWRSIQSLYASKLIKKEFHPDGSITLTLSDRGRKRALTYKLDDVKIKPASKWDGKWRLIAFDVPENRKKTREALRFHFREMGLLHYQKSIFISPYPCDEEADFVIEFFNARPFVRKIIADTIDNELHFKQKFHLLKS